VPPSDIRLEVAPYDYAAAERLVATLGVSHVVAFHAADGLFEKFGLPPTL